MHRRAGGDRPLLPPCAYHRGRAEAVSSQPAGTDEIDVLAVVTALPVPVQGGARSRESGPGIRRQIGVSLVPTWSPRR
jgi:hypothetical protein